MVLTVFVNAINLMFVYSWIIYELDVGGKVQHKQIKDETVGNLLEVAAKRPDNDSRSQHQFGTMVEVTNHRFVLLENA